MFSPLSLNIASLFGGIAEQLRHDPRGDDVERVVGRAADGLKRRLLEQGLSENEIEARVQKALHFISIGIEFCESPAESMLLAALVCANFGPLPQPAVWDQRRRLSDTFLIVPQLIVGPFRIDLAVVRPGVPIIAIECDGAKFHDKVRDERRDAFLARLGIVTYRIAAQDIFSSPRDAADTLTRWIGFPK